MLIETRAYFTDKKLTASQAKTELKEGIEIARRIYVKKVPEFREVWDKYGKKIDAFGYGMYSKIVMVVAQKLDGCARISEGNHDLNLILYLLNLG